LSFIKKAYYWYKSLSRRVRDSVSFSVFCVGLISTICTIIGFSLADKKIESVRNRFLVVIVLAIALYFVAYIVIGSIFKDRIGLVINNTPVEIMCGDITKTEEYKVIGCDTHFHTTVDDVIISKNSLHGKLVLDHGNAEEIKAAVKKEAERLKLNPDADGLYDFPLGTIIRYDSSVDKNTYLMVAMTELDKDYESHTNMAKYEHMLMKMWNEISRVYASHDIVLPILGDGIARFDDRPKDRYTLIRCMLCTLSGSGIHYNSKIRIMIYGRSDDTPLYELNDIVKSLGRG